MKILESVGTVLLSVLLTIVIIWTISLLGIGLYASSVCKANGYRKMTMGFPLTPYCVRIIDQTEYVVPLMEIKQFKYEIYKIRYTNISQSRLLPDWGRCRAISKTTRKRFKL